MTFTVCVLQMISDDIEVFLINCENDFVEYLLKAYSLFLNREI